MPMINRFRRPSGGSAKASAEAVVKNFVDFAALAAEGDGIEAVEAKIVAVDFGGLKFGVRIRADGNHHAAWSRAAFRVGNGQVGLASFCRAGIGSVVQAQVNLVGVPTKKTVSATGVEVSEMAGIDPADELELLVVADEGRLEWRCDRPGHITCSAAFAAAFKADGSVVLSEDEAVKAKVVEAVKADAAKAKAVEAAIKAAAEKAAKKAAKKA